MTAHPLDETSHGVRRQTPDCTITGEGGNLALQSARMESSSKERSGNGRPAWRPSAQLLRRAFAVDLLVCARCGGRSQVVPGTSLVKAMLQGAPLFFLSSLPRHKTRRVPRQSRLR